MPILYQQNKQTMIKQINEMSQQEAKDYLFILNLPVMNGYTTEQAAIMVRLVKTFIDPNQRDCAHCGTTGGLRQAKDKFILFYRANGSAINAIADGSFEQPKEELLPIIEEVKEEKPKRKSKKDKE